MPNREAYNKQKMRRETDGEDASALDATLTIRLTKEKLKNFKREAVENNVPMATIINAFIDLYIDGTFTYNKQTKKIEE